MGGRKRGRVGMRKGWDGGGAQGEGLSVGGAIGLHTLAGW